MDDAAGRQWPDTPVGSAGAGRWRITVVEETASTNADLLASAATGAAEGEVLVAQFQSGGRGRLDRSWVSPAGAGLTFSVLLRPRLPASAWGWLPLVTGLALVGAVGGDARLKWPNDLLLGPEAGKAAGILAQTAGGAAVIGVGLNVGTAREELPVESATSLLLAGHTELDRPVLLGRFLDRFGDLYDAWQHGDAAVAAAYRAVCATIGSLVSVQLADRVVLGEAVGVDDNGQLTLQTAGGSPLRVAAGDVTHVRAATAPGSLP